MPARSPVKVSWPESRSVTIVAPACGGTLPPSTSSALGEVGSEPGRSLSNGRILIGVPTSPRMTSGWACAAKDVWSSGACTRKVIDRSTGAERPSVTAKSTRTVSSRSVFAVGAVKRIRPSAVMRAVAPDCSPATARAESRSSMSPSRSSRQSERTGTARAPRCGTW